MRRLEKIKPMQYGKKYKYK
jgi:hypothetical protein